MKYITTWTEFSWKYDNEIEDVIEETENEDGAFMMRGDCYIIRKGMVYKYRA